MNMKSLGFLLIISGLTLMFVGFENQINRLDNRIEAVYCYKNSTAHLQLYPDGKFLCQTN